MCGRPKGKKTAGEELVQNRQSNQKTLRRGEEGGGFFEGEQGKLTWEKKKRN